MPSYRGTLTTKFPNESFGAPYVTARLGWAGAYRELPALIDSGADQSVVPILMARALRLPKVDEIDLEDANGNSITRDVVVANLDFHGFTFQSLPFATSDYPTILLGRDILNDFVTCLDGPQGVFTISS